MIGNLRHAAAVAHAVWRLPDTLARLDALEGWSETYAGDLDQFEGRLDDVHALRQEMHTAGGVDMRAEGGGR